MLGSYQSPKDHPSFRLGSEDPDGAAHFVHNNANEPLKYYWICAADGHLKYAICDSRWDGLDIVDYSLLSLLAYMDPKSGRDQVEQLLQIFFPVKGSNNQSLFVIQYAPMLFQAVVARVVSFA